MLLGRRSPAAQWRCRGGRRVAAGVADEHDAETRSVAWVMVSGGNQGLFRTFGAVGAGHRIGGSAPFLMRPASWLGGQRSRRGRTWTA